MLCETEGSGPIQDNDWCQPMIAHSHGEFVVPRASAALEKHRADTALAFGGCEALQPNSSGLRQRWWWWSSVLVVCARPLVLLFGRTVLMVETLAEMRMFCGIFHD